MNENQINDILYVVSEVIGMDSILDSVKKQLGLIDVSEFDADIIMHINGAITTLTQLGVGPEEGYIVVDDQNTYEQFLGPDHPGVSQVKLYLYYKTKLGFDPPQSSAVIEVLKNLIAETEWRLNVLCDKGVDEGGDKNEPIRVGT